MANPKRAPKQHGARPRPKPGPRPDDGGGRPMWLPGVAVLGLVAAAVAIFLLTRPGQAPPPPPKHVDLVAPLTSVSSSELNAVGKGSANNRFARASDAPLTSGGKPVLLYMGAEYCPYCAGERWALIVALSRFGTFSNVKPITSSEASLPTFTFHGSTYTSAYLVFRPVEQLDGQDKPLDTATAEEVALNNKYAQGTIPFVDFGNQLVVNGATYDVGVLQGLDWQQVETQLRTPGTDQAQGILGSANLITAGICRMTGDQPGAVCSDPMIQGLERQLPGS